MADTRHRHLGDSHAFDFCQEMEGFMLSLRLEEPCELDEGDVGPCGGLATVEGPFEHLKSPSVELDRVQRFGGLASVDLPWPEDKADKDASELICKITNARFDEQDRMLKEICIKLASGLQALALDRPQDR